MAASEWDEYAADWDDDPAARAYAAAAFESLTDALDRRGFDLDGAKVCDFGCGTGLLTERLVDRCGKIDAVDSSPAMLAVLDAKARRLGWTGVRISEALASASENYDLIVCSSVCGFLDDYPRTVAALAATLAPGGVFVQWDWEADPAQPESDGLTRDAIRDALAGAGLREVSVDVGFSLEFEGAAMAPVMGVGRAPTD